jgi:hypothetical protein
MKNTKTIALALLISSLLTACGGGSDSPSEYWYGQVWRPLTGTVLKTYPENYSTESECMKQTAWKTEFAVGGVVPSNLGWTCVHVVQK